jgi:uncharacterized protein (TIGR01777 family)
MRIVLAGGSGFLGTAIARRCAERGDTVVRLVRGDPAGPAERHWHPRAGALDPAVLADADAVISLGGASVARRWTTGARRLIRDSRVDVTTTVARAVAAAGPRPPVLLSASAIGFYGDTGDTGVDESSPAGDGFLAEVCRVWEAATRPAEDAGARVVHLRTGLVLAAGGGLLGPMLPQFRFGLGGRMGNGRQYWPWIALTDWLDAVWFTIERPDLAGPVNLVGPAPVTNTAFVAALGRVTHRPTLLPAPAAALRLVLGLRQ